MTNLSNTLKVYQKAIHDLQRLFNSHFCIRPLEGKKKHYQFQTESNKLLEITSSNDSYETFSSKQCFKIA